MRRIDLRLVPAAAVAWGVAWLLVGSPAAAAVVAAVVLWLGAGAVIAAAILVPSVRTAAAIVAIALAGGALVATTVAVREPLRSPDAIIDDREFEVVLTGPVLDGADRARGTIGASPVLVVGLELAHGAGLGATLLVHGHLEPVEPGGAIVAMLVCDRAEVIRAPAAVLAWGEGLRAGFRTVTAGLPGDGGALLTGLAIGDDAGVAERLAEAMTSTSLSHLTAVSGANCAVVIGAALLLSAALGMPRLVRLGVAAGMLVAFVVLVTPQPSVVRAAVMAALALLALAVDRPIRGVSLLALAMTVVLAVDPWASREVGFVLSVLATAGLLLVAEPLAGRLVSVLPRPLAFLVAIPIAAQLACQPVIVLIDPALSLVGVVANLLAGPAAPIATGLGLIACMLQPIAPVLALGTAWLAWVASSWIAAVATVLADVPFARLAWPEGAVGFVLAAAGSAAIAWWAVSAGRAGRIAGAAALIWAVVVTGVGVGGVVVAGLGRPGGWTIAQCDVGQGDAVVLRSAEAVALVDTGPDPAVLDTCLDSLGVDRIDLLVLTHFDLDHVGGSDAVLGAVGTVLIGPTDERAESTVIEPLVAAGAVVHRVSAGRTGVLGVAPWRVLWPPAGTDEPGNAASVVLRIETNPPIVLLGDLGAEEQQRMLAVSPPGRVAVMKVSHHGSADQSARLIAAVGAGIGLIGVGADNGYGHPTPELLAMLAAAGTTVVRSDRDGLVLLAPAVDGGIAVWRERGGAASAGAARLDPAPAPPGSIVTAAVGSIRGTGGRDGRTRRAGRTSPGVVVRALVGSHPTGGGGARHRSRAVPRRPGRIATARPPPGRGPEPRGERSRGRHGERR
jgi:competence protein ComEC